MVNGTVSELLAGRLPFATVRIGTFRNAPDLHRALIDGGYEFSTADNCLDKIPLATEPEDIDVYSISNSELGLPENVTVAEVFEAIAAIGGKKLPAEVGPMLRLQKPDQDKREELLIYMDTLEDPNGHKLIFIVSNYKDQLHLYYGAAQGYTLRYDATWLIGFDRP